MGWRMVWLAPAVALVWLGLSSPAPSAPATISAASHTCWWSYFGDARAIAAGGRILWGCITGVTIHHYPEVDEHFNQLDRIHPFRSITPGRAWPHDVAVEGRRRPVVVYTRRHDGANGTDFFWYARWNGARWERHRIVSAGIHALAFVSGGITLDHAQPSRVVLSRRAALGFQIELWRTPDGGRSWDPPLAITPSSHDRNYRPVIPRGYQSQGRVVVLYLHGWMRCCRTFRRIQSVVRLSSVDTTEPPPTESGR
jgi:hypothetical protein